VLLHTEARHLIISKYRGEPCLEVRQQGEITVHDPGFQPRADGRPYPRDGCDVPCSMISRQGAISMMERAAF
jgi:hypothetical protein